VAELFETVQAVLASTGRSKAERRVENEQIDDDSTDIGGLLKPLHDSGQLGPLVPPPGKQQKTTENQENEPAQQNTTRTTKTGVPASRKVGDLRLKISLRGLQTPTTPGFSCAPQDTACPPNLTL